MNIIKLGGSIVNPNGKYDLSVIDEFIELVRDSQEKFIFVIGGGKICRDVQNTAFPFLINALGRDRRVNLAKDWVGIAVTKINAAFLLEQFKEELDEQVYPEIILDPTQKITSNARIYFAGGWKPGCSTDKDMMLLAKTFAADKIFKTTNISFIKRIKPTDLVDKKEEEKKELLKNAEDIHQMTWWELKELVGDEWIPGLNTPFDPEAVKLGTEIKPTLYIGKKEELLKVLKNQEFVGTVVKG